jgi:SAM-dependent methyltransferase
VDANEWDARYADSELVWGLEPNRFVRAQCERLPVGRAIDLACGEGRNALWLARLGWHATGVDYSQVAIDRARELTTKESAATAARLTWKVADVTTETLKPAAYDLVLISYLHLPPDEIHTVLRNAAQGVRPRGHLVVVGHDRRNLREGVSGPQDESRLYDVADIRAVLSEVPDLVMELGETVTRPTPDGDALDTLVRARRLEPDR